MSSFIQFISEMARDRGTDLSYLPKEKILGTKLSHKSKVTEIYKGYNIHMFRDIITVVDKDDIIKGYISLDDPIFKDKNCKAVHVSNLHPDLRGKGIGYKLYKTLLKYYDLVMDIQTSDHAIKIWVKLSNDNDVRVDAIDFYNGKILAQDIKLPGKVKEIWSEFDIRDNTIYHKDTNKEMDKELALYYARISLKASLK